MRAAAYWQGGRLSGFVAATGLPLPFDLLAQLPEFQHDIVSNTAPDTGATLAAAMFGLLKFWQEFGGKFEV